MDLKKVTEPAPSTSSSSKKKPTTKKRRLENSACSEDDDTEDYRTAADTFITNILDCGFTSPRDVLHSIRPLDGTPECTLLPHWQPVSKGSAGAIPAAIQDDDSVQNFLAREAGHLLLHDLNAEVRCRPARGSSSTASGPRSEESHLVGRLSAVKTPWSITDDWIAQVPAFNSVALPNHDAKAPGFSKSPFACSSPPARKAERKALKQSGLQHCLDTCLNVGMAVTAMDLQPAAAEEPSSTSSSSSSSSSSTNASSGFWLAVGGGSIGGFGNHNPHAAEANLLGVPTAGANLIQIWFLPCSHNSEGESSSLVPWLVYGLLHDHGGVRDLKWAPLGSSALPFELSTGAATHRTERAGVLAVAAGDAAVRVYALPTHAGSGASASLSGAAAAAAPVLRLAPLAVCNAPCMGITIETIRWRPVAWGCGGGQRKSCRSDVDGINDESTIDEGDDDNDDNDDDDEYDRNYGLNCLAAGASDGTLLVWSLPNLAHTAATNKNDGSSSRSSSSSNSSNSSSSGPLILKPTRTLLSLSAMRACPAQMALRTIAWAPDSAAQPPGSTSGVCNSDSDSGGGGGGGGLVACVDTHGMARLWDLALPRGPILEAASLRKESSGMGPTSSQQWVKTCAWAPRSAGLFVAGATPNAVLMQRWRRNAMRLTKHPWLHEGIVAMHVTNLAPKVSNKNNPSSGSSSSRGNGVNEGDWEPSAAAAGIDVMLSASSDGSLFVAGLAAAIYDNAPRIRHKRTKLGRALALSGLAAVPPFGAGSSSRAAGTLESDARESESEGNDTPARPRRVFEVSRSPVWVDTSNLPYTPPVVPKAKKGGNSSGRKAFRAGEKGASSGGTTADGEIAAADAAEEAAREAAFGLCPGGGRAALTTMCCAHMPLATPGHQAADLLVCSGSVCGLVRVQSLAAATADQFRN